MTAPASPFQAARPRVAAPGFTLVELLCVVAVVVLLAALTMPALQRLGAANLTNAGAKLSGILEMARQTAITTRQPVAVVILPQEAEKPLRVTCLQYNASKDYDSGGVKTHWQQFSGWENFSGLTLDNQDSEGNALKSFTPGGSPKTDNPLSNTTADKTAAAKDKLPTLRYQGNSYAAGGSGYGYIVFRPDGSLFRDSSGKPALPCLVRLVAGFKTGTDIVYRGAKDAKGHPANYFEIIVTDATGQIKTHRP